jgi:hypothetical protein
MGSGLTSVILVPKQPLTRSTIMPTYEVIVGNVGSVYCGKNRADALATYQSYVESSKEQVGARSYGEDVTLLADGEIEQEHIGHLRRNSQIPNV